MDTLPKIDNSSVKGTYRHYKGGLFTVLGIGRHSETLEELVFYRHNEGDDKGGAPGDLWVRPRAMFFETITIDGIAKPRFTKVD